MRVQLVVNPAAGGGRALRSLPAVQAALSVHDVVVTQTRSLEHADELSAAAVADERVVLALGGDGLVGRVAGAVAPLAGVMSVLPGGRGNDFCRTVGIPLDAAAAAAALPSWTARPVDLGYADGRAFIGIASIGFDSDVQEKVLTSRLPLGNLIYAYGSLAVVAGWKPARFTITVDGVRSTIEGWNVAVANSGRYGGGMILAPGASVHDGLLDLVTTSTTSKLQFLRTFPKLFKGTHVSDPSFSVRTVSAVTLEADRPFRVFADGDPVAALPCEVTVSPAALHMLLP